MGGESGIIMPLKLLVQSSEASALLSPASMARSTRSLKSLEYALTASSFFLAICFFLAFSHLTTGSRILPAAVAVVCGLGKSDAISGISPEQFELRLLLVDGFKTRQTPEATKYR